MIISCDKMKACLFVFMVVATQCINVAGQLCSKMCTNYCPCDFVKASDGCATCVCQECPSSRRRCPEHSIPTRMTCSSQYNNCGFGRFCNPQSNRCCRRITTLRVGECPAVYRGSLCLYRRGQSCRTDGQCIGLDLKCCQDQCRGKTCQRVPTITIVG